MADIDAPQPWERLPGEPNRWYDRFERYRLMGASRSMLSAYQAEAAGLGRKKRTRVPGSWDVAAERYHWIERAEAWDEHIRERDRQQFEAERADGIANRVNRWQEGVERHKLLKQVMAERAASSEMQGIPGGTTGLIVREPQVVKVYESDGDEDDETLTPTRRHVVMYVYSIDTGLLKELREHEKHVATQLGEWTESKSLSGPGGGPLKAEVRTEHDLARDALLNPEARRLAAEFLRSLEDETGGHPGASG